MVTRHGQTAAAEQGFNVLYGGNQRGRSRERYGKDDALVRSVGSRPATAMIGSVLRVIRDLFTVLFDMIYWVWRTLWSLNRGVVRSLMPGQGKVVHTVVTYLVVMLEIVGLWVAAVAWAAKN